MVRLTKFFPVREKAVCPPEALWVDTWWYFCISTHDPVTVTFPVPFISVIFLDSILSIMRVDTYI